MGVDAIDFFALGQFYRRMVATRNGNGHSNASHNGEVNDRSAVQHGTG